MYQKIAILSFVLITAFALSALADDSGRIYGRITTDDGDTFEGLIRWDKNEGSWVDVLDGNKKLPDLKKKESKRKKYRDQGTSIELFGLKIGNSNSKNWFDVAQSGIRFGHIKKMEVSGDESVLLTLKSGEEIELENGSTDIGENIRELIIEDINEGEIELVWGDLETVEFEKPEKNLESNFGERLYGTLTTRRGDEFTGYVCWDVDELFTNDILDGEENGRSRKIKFGKIASIQRYSSSGAVLKLVNGDDLTLKGSNDVDDSNRGIVVSDPGFGQVVVNWDEFDNLIFSRPDRQISYDDFDGGKNLYGTVYTEDGEKYTGQIRWDNDEEYTWEILDGEYRNIDFDIEFGKIKEIEKKSYRSSQVTMLDGRTFRLRGSNDVDEDNKGIFVKQSDGEEVEVEWDDFEKLELTK